MNYDYIKNIKPIKNYFIIIIFLIISVIIILLFFTRCYDTYQTYATYDGKSLNVSVQINSSDIIKKAHYFKHNSMVIKYKIDKVSDLLLKDNENYQIYVLKIDKGYFKENEVGKIVFYFKRERIIKKILRIIF